MPVDIFELRTMMAALEEMKPPRTFLLDSFFRNEETFPTESVDVDLVVGQRRLAPFVSPRHEGQIVSKEGYKTESYKPPYVKPKDVTTAQNYLKRTPGEAVYAGSKTPQQRAAEQLGKDMYRLRESIVRREEWMAAQAMNTGTINVVGEGVDDVIDFQFAPAQLVQLTGTDVWTDANADPIQDLRTWKRERAQASGIACDRVVLGSNVIDPFLERLKAKLDTRRIDLGMIKPEQLPEGVTYFGHLNDPGLDFFSYDEWYLDDTGTEVAMVPNNVVLMGSTRARATRAYGAIQDVEAIESGMVEAKIYPKTWIKKDPSVRMLMLQSAPLVIPTQIGAFFRAIVLTVL